jgi:hypothetical protein
MSSLEQLQRRVARLTDVLGPVVDRPCPCGWRQVVTLGAAPVCSRCRRRQVVYTVEIVAEGPLSTIVWPNGAVRQYGLDVSRV